MTELETLEVPAEFNGGEGVDKKPQPESLLDGLRERRSALATERRITLPVPGYEDKLLAHYKSVEHLEVKRLMERAQRAAPNEDVVMSADLLIASCEFLEGKPEEKFIPLHEIPEFRSLVGEEPIGYDARLAKCLGIETETARGVVTGLLQNDHALIVHANFLVSWMQESWTEDDADFAKSS